jgi:hypothetical protein
MPDSFEGLSARAYRDGHAGCILFELLESTANSITDQPLQVQIEYHQGYALRMSATEFWALTQNDMDLYPRFARKRLTNGTVVHETMTDGVTFHSAAEVDR